MMTIVFSLCVLLSVYAFVLYPALLFVLSRRPRPTAARDDHLPPVSVLVPVYNEEATVEAKLQNCLELDYPADRLEIVFASDGSTDRTASILRSRADPRVRVIECPQNRGKTAVLAETIPQLKGEVVVLTDATGMLNAAAIRKMVRHFADPEVGGVCGFYRILREGRTRLDSAESSYHGVEMLLRFWEGRIRTTLSGTGALCAIRKADYRPLPPHIINEDYVLTSRIALSGKRVVYDPAAQIADRLSTSPAHVFRRRVRIAYGNWQQVVHLKALLNPARGYLSWIFYSHKLLRMLMPLVLILLVASSLGLPQAVWAPVVAGLGALAVLGLAGLVLDRVMKDANPLSVVVLVFLNFAAVIVGTFKYLAGRPVKW